MTHFFEPLRHKSGAKIHFFCLSAKSFEEFFYLNKELMELRELSLALLAVELGTIEFGKLLPCVLSLTSFTPLTTLTPQSFIPRSFPAAWRFRRAGWLLP